MTGTNYQTNANGLSSNKNLEKKKQKLNSDQRERLRAKRSSNFDKIKDLERQNKELDRELCLLSDDKQWFTEKEEEHVVSRRPKKVEKLLIGKINWKEFFKDADYPDDPSKGFWIERSQTVRINGKWVGRLGD